MLNHIRLLLLASWLGAAVFFSAVVAPTAFRVLRTFDLPNQSEIAGAIVSHTLSFINLTGVIISMMVLVTTFALKNTLALRSFNFQIILLLIVASATATGEWIIAARMRAVRFALDAAVGGPIDQVPATNEGRIAFAALHGYSVVALSVAMIAALLAFFLISRRSPVERR